MELTRRQKSQIESLCKNPLISYTALVFRECSTQVTIHSNPDADWNSVDSLLNEIFPDAEYRGKPHVELRDGKIYELYDIKTGIPKVYVELFMVKTVSNP